MSDPALSGEDISVVRGGTTVLDSVTVSVESADRMLIQGPSGSGKTTLFSVLGLLVPPTEGIVTVGGRDTSTLSERERARLRRTFLGFVYQDFKLVPDLTARENAALPQELRGERDEGWLDELFETLAIEAITDRYPSALSGGEKQRVATARALANRPSVVLADEPTGQLDPETADRIVDFLCSLGDDHDVALVVVSHDRSIEHRFPCLYELVDGSLARADR